METGIIDTVLDWLVNDFRKSFLTCFCVIGTCRVTFDLGMGPRWAGKPIAAVAVRSKVVRETSEALSYISVVCIPSPKSQIISSQR